MELDAIIISESGKHGLTGIIPERLTVGGRPCSIQVVLNGIRHDGQVIPPIAGDGVMNWWSAPKLNGIFLFSYLSRRDFNVALINKYYPEREEFSELLKANPRAIIISTSFIRSRHALAELIDDIRSLAPDVFIIVGGPFIYYSYLVLQRSTEKGYSTDGVEDDFLFFNQDDPRADLYIVSLMGEEILGEALARIKSDRSTGDLPNSARLEEDGYHFTKRINDVAKGGRAEIDWNSLPGRLFNSGVMPLQASRGCPHKCAFCNFVKDRRLLFVKPLENLMEELRTVNRRGARYVWFVDDNFRHGSKDLNTFCRYIIDEGMDLRWMTMVRADTLEAVDMTLLRESGCVEVQLGLESADPQILKAMNKKAGPALYAEVVRRVLEVGINCSCYFIFGFPGETDETALRTRAFIHGLEHSELEGTLSWSLFPFSLYPLSPIYEVEKRRQYGLNGYLRQWRHRSMDSDRAVEHVRAAFLELSNSCPVYRGDNLNALLSLSPRQRKDFLITRHKVSKAAMKGEIGEQDIMRSFTEVLS